MTQLDALIIVLEHEVNVLRGLRLSQDTAVASAAVARERAVESDLARLRKQSIQSSQPEMLPLTGRAA